MRRREFISGIALSAAWPLATRAQAERLRRIGVIIPTSAEDEVAQTRLGAFLQGLQETGWVIGRNVRIDTRWATPNVAEIRRHAKELAALTPDVILAHGTSTVAPLLQMTKTIPIIFPVAADPVAAGFVDSLARPGGNATGFISNEYTLSGKWLELLKEIMPGITRAAVLRNSATPSGPAQFAVIQSVATSLKVEVIPINAREAGEIEHSIENFSLSPNGGLIVTSGPAVQRHRDLIVALVRRQKLPAVYYEGSFVHRGGLASYGPDLVHQYRLSAGYVDRILKGGKPADLPVQTPTKYELLINLKAANALGITFPLSLLGRADEVIE
jgi:putative ABC transport system substrate-binding protein